MIQIIENIAKTIGWICGALLAIVVASSAARRGIIETIKMLLKD